ELREVHGLREVAIEYLVDARDDLLAELLLPLRRADVVEGLAREEREQEIAHLRQVRLHRGRDVGLAEVDLERRLQVTPGAVVGEVRDERLEREDVVRLAARLLRLGLGGALALFPLDRGRRRRVLRRPALERADAEVPERDDGARNHEHSAPDQRE